MQNRNIPLKSQTFIDHLEKEPKDTLQLIFSYLKKKEVFALRNTCKKAHGKIKMAPYREIYAKYYLNKAKTVAERWWEIEKNLIYFTFDTGYRSLALFWKGSQGNFVAELGDNIFYTCTVSAGTIANTLIGPPLLAATTCAASTASIYGFFVGTAKDIRQHCNNRKSEYRGIQFSTPSKNTVNANSG